MRLVRFRAAETFYTSPCVGQRVFKIDIAETPTSPDINGLDLCATVGPNAAYVKTITNVSVTDGTRLTTRTTSSLRSPAGVQASERPSPRDPRGRC